MNNAAYNSWVNQQLEPDQKPINTGCIAGQRWLKHKSEADTIRNKEYAASFLPGENEYERGVRMRSEHLQWEDEYLKSKGI